MFDQLEAVLKGLNGAVGTLKALAAKSQEAIQKAEALAAEVKAKEASLAEREADIALREEVMAGKESSLLSSSEIASKSDVIEQAKVALENEKKDFNRFISKKKAELDQERSSLMDLKSGIDAAKKSLEKEKAEYKQKLLKEMTKVAGV